MTFHVPIYVEVATEPGASDQTFTARPLFHAVPTAGAPKLTRAVDKLRSKLTNHLSELSLKARHDELAAWSVDEEVRVNVVSVRLELKSGSSGLKVFLVGMERFGRRLWHSPQLPELWFEVSPAQNLAERAQAALERYLRTLEKEREGVDLADVFPPRVSEQKLLFLEVKPTVTDALAAKEDNKRMSIFSSSAEKRDGARELARVGRRLAGESDEASSFRSLDSLATEIVAKMTGQSKRAVLISGPRMVGKTALIQQAARLMPAKKGQRWEIWQISPMRLISGMSYVGQWENRVLAILAHAEKKRIALYFDDLLGLLSAGQSCGNDLSVARVLRPWIEERRIRVLAEITPEALRVLRERDRPLADAFETIPLAEPDDETNLRILIHVARELERLHGCRFDVDVLPAVIDLQRRFTRDAAFPGKAAAFLQRLAVKHSHGVTCGAEQARAEFQERSGLMLALIDDSREMSRRSVVDDLRRQVLGQDHALHAFADVLIRLKARLNDPAKPLAAMLLLGPTGVGKTEAAKALAKYLFGDERRLLRFDMNEMAGGGVARLTGSPSHPEGELTGAIRRQPFAVVLFDEIEKASPEVFDMLLAVLDEGRLTDALGRVADFTNAVILLTSNLGATEAASRVGFTRSAEDEEAGYRSAAERFFRPEFFNRLDAVLPFRPLAGDDLSRIASLLLDKMTSRDGLRQRRCFMEITPAARERLVALGRHPKLGARALKRAVEREVAEPLALELSAMPATQPVQVVFDAGAGEGFALRARPVRLAPRRIFWPERLAKEPDLARQVPPLCRAALERAAKRIDEIEPAGPVEWTALTPSQARYFRWREQWRRVERMAEAAERSLRPARASSSRVQPMRRPHPKARKLVLHTHRGVSVTHDREREAEELRSAWEEITEGVVEEIIDTPMTELAREVALLEAILGAPLEAGPLVLRLRAGTSHEEGIPALMEQWRRVLASVFGDGAATRENEWLGLSVSDPGAQALAETFPSATWADHEFHPDTLWRLARTDGRGDEGPDGPIEAELRVHVGLGEFGEDMLVTDLRSGLQARSRDGVAPFRAMILSALPLPEELRALLDGPGDCVVGESVNPRRPVETRPARDAMNDLPF